MRVSFTKMQGAGNDFVVLDATRSPLALSRAQLRRLGDRRLGVGCDQILVVEPARSEGVDFAYRIFNGADGGEVEQCGNGARCFVRFVRARGLSAKAPLVVETMKGRLVLEEGEGGRVAVDMGAPVFALARVPFDASGLVPRGDDSDEERFALWPLDVDGEQIEVAVLSMGNPHAVQFVADVDAAPVERLGPRIERHPRFAERVNAGFVHVVGRDRVRLRVYERGAGETLACGTGACAAVVAGIRLGLLDARVDVETRGGLLMIEWQGRRDGLGAAVLMTGPAETVFEGAIDL